MSEEVVQKVRVGSWVFGRVEDTPTPEQIAATDVAFVIDATGSMGPWVEEARRQAKVAADAIIAGGHLDARFLLVAYRDHPPQEQSWVTQHWYCNGTYELKECLAKLSAVGGGDAPEAVWDGVECALSGFQWRQGSARLLYLIGDSPPHGHVAFGDAFPQGCPCGLHHLKLIDRLRQLNVTVHAVSIAGNRDTTRAFRLLSDATGGSCVEAQTPAQMTKHYGEVLGGVAYSNRVAAGLVAEEKTSGGMLYSAEGLAAYAAETGTPLADVEAAKASLQARGLVK